MKPLSLSSSYLTSDPSGISITTFTSSGGFLPTASFDSKMRQALLDCCYIDWSKISPAIFGSLFQSVMNPTERRYPPSKVHLV